MRRKEYKSLPSSIKNASSPIKTEKDKYIFIKKINDGSYLKNFRSFEVLKCGNEKSKVCSLCINRLACSILKSDFCSGDKFLPENEYIPTFNKIENSSQLSAAMGYFYTYLAGWFRRLSVDEDKYYRESSEPKRSGGVRIVYEPTANLKMVQQRLLENILYKYIKFPDHVTGCAKNKCTMDNASPHVLKPVVIKMDLKDFFPSVYSSRVYKCLKRYFSEHVSKMIIRLCSYKGHTAQGIPTSGHLANLSALDMDIDLLTLCNNMGWEYTRYVDDMTFSVKRGVTEVSREVVDKMITSIYPIVGRNCFTINSTKTRIMRKHRRQKVTGIVVNQKPNIPKFERNNLRAIIHNCNKYGIDSQLRGARKKNFIQKINGYMSYMKTINQELWEKYNDDWRQAKSRAVKADT